jgi:cytidylate kinase
MTILTRQERERLVLDLYNQGKTTRKIAKIERMSIRDISPTLKEEESKRQKHKDQQQQEELFAKTYELFSEGKRPVEVAISNLSEK